MPAPLTRIALSFAVASIFIYQSAIAVVGASANRLLEQHSGDLCVENVAFLSPDSELLKSIAESARVLEASMVLTSPQGGRCGATQVSNSGHVLTSQHCLEKCLIESGALTTTEREFGATQPIRVRVLQRNPAITAPTCAISIGGRGVQNFEAKISALGSCRMLPPTDHEYQNQLFGHSQNHLPLMSGRY